MSGGSVNAKDRQAFLVWLGTNHELKQPAALDVFRFILSSDERLERLRIVDDGSYLRPLLVVAARGRRQPGLLYQTLQGSSSDAAAIIADLALTRGPFYLAPYLPAARRSVYYERAREKGLRTVTEVYEASVAGSDADRFLAELSLPVKRAELGLLIDQALERRDRKAFRELVAVWKKLSSAKNLVILAE